MYEGHKNIYEYALRNMIHFGWSNENSIYDALKQFLENSDENKKLIILGEEIYIDYLMYKKRIDEGRYNSFLPLFDSILGDCNPKSKEDRENFIKRSIYSDESFKEKLTIAKIAHEYFHKENFERYLGPKKVI
jgi:hypothetical protein